MQTLSLRQSTTASLLHTPIQPSWPFSTSTSDSVTNNTRSMDSDHTPSVPYSESPTTEHKHSNATGGPPHHLRRQSSFADQAKNSPALSSTPTPPPLRSSMAISSILSQPQPLGRASLTLPVPMQQNQYSYDSYERPSSASISPNPIPTSLKEGYARLTREHYSPSEMSTPSPTSKKRRLSPPIEVEHQFHYSDEHTLTEERDAAHRKHWKAPTGHRRGITVKEMLPLTAPTQPRRSSSRKFTQNTALPPPNDTYTQRNVPLPRADASRYSGSGESEEDGGGEEDPHYANPTHDTPTPPPAHISPASVAPEEDAAALKRRQNTVAARRSRQRKLEHVRTLESKVQELSTERDELKVRCSRLEDRVAFLKEMIVSGRQFGGKADVDADMF